MVFELITSSSRLRHTPLLMFFEAIFITFLSVFLAMFIFPNNYTSIATLAFLTIGAVPLFNKLYSRDSYLFNYNKPFFQRHKKLMLLLLFFFLGVLVALILAYLILPSGIRTNVFSSQLSELGTIDQIRTSITGQLTGPANTGVSYKGLFSLIFKNNLMVVLSAALLSFFYGAGAIFLIGWNASILATVIAKDVAISLSGASGLGISGFFTGIVNAALNFLGFIPHGLPEVLAYLIASFAGALLARDLLKGIFSTEFRWMAIKDIVLMFFFAILLLLLSALLEASYFV